MAEPIRIRVGASADSSLTGVFRPFVEAAKAARKQVEAELNSLSVNIKQKVKVGVEGAATETRKLPAAAKKSTDDATKEAERWAKNVDRLAKQAAREFEKGETDKVRAAARAEAAKTRELEKAEANRQRIRERSATMAGAWAVRESNREAREAARVAARQARANVRDVRGRERQSERNWAQVGYGAQHAARIVGRAGSMALNAGTQVAGDLVRGMGVNTDLGSMFKANTDLETQGVNVTNSGYMAGAAGANGQRQDAREVTNQMRAIGSQTGFSAGDAMTGLSSFVGKTGDLETGRAVMKDMAILSRATGTALEDMVAAAADVSNNLGDIPDKGKAINEVMKQIAGEGKLGAVEIKDLATQMAKVGAAAGQIEGKASDNIALLGAFAQEARQRGGAASATQAATSVQGLINTFKTPARAAAFEAATGKKVFNDQGMVRNPQELLMEALRSSGMNPTAFKKIFANVAGGRAVEGFATVYRQAGGGAAGEAAVTAEFERLKQAALDDAEIMDSFNRSMRTSEAQANVLNNAFQATAQEAQDVLTPALLALVPAALDAAKGMASILTWVVGQEDEVKSHVKHVTEDVDSDVKNTEKQIQSGQILPQQMDKNRADEKLAFEAKSQAQAEWLGHTGDRMSGTSKTIAKASDYLPATWAFNKVTGGVFSGESAVNRNEAKQDERRESASKAQEAYDKIHGANERIADRLLSGVLTVKVVQMPPPPGLPPNNPGAKGQPGAHVETVHE